MLLVNTFEYLNGGRVSQILTNEFIERFYRLNMYSLRSLLFINVFKD